MAALLLLALVAAMSKRFHELDLLYKCLLISLLLHVLWLVWMRYVHPETEKWGIEREQRSPAFRVRLEPAQERQRGLVERGGVLEPTRGERSQSEIPELIELARVERMEAQLAASPELERAEAEAAEVPERGEL